MLTFCVDKFIGDVPYPNLATWLATPLHDTWHEFSRNWPFSEPVHFFEYLDQENIIYQVVPTDQGNFQSVYPISISFFDFTVDWFKMIPQQVLDKKMLIWFLYSEGDNPYIIEKHLQKQASEHGVEFDRIHFTSANTAAKSINGFSYFPDDELLFRLRNNNDPVRYHETHRSKKFTALVRTHKWWRATTMARLWSQNLDKLGYFSYNKEIDLLENEFDNPIEIFSFQRLRADVENFLNACPFSADILSSREHNLYHTTVHEHFADSYLNIVLETHLDADKSGGTFLTEKTFKPIKNCQLFVLLAPPYSIAQLRKMGYRTFDHVIDHSYDTIENNTKRWDCAMKEIERLIKHEHLHSLYTESKEDLKHNQNLFLSSKYTRLNTLLGNLQK